MQMVVVGDLPHVVVEEPACGILRVGDARRARACMAARSSSVGLARCVAEHGHRHVARIAIEHDEAERLVELGVPRGAFACSSHSSQGFMDLTQIHEGL